LAGLPFALLLAGCASAVQNPDGSTTARIAAGGVSYHFAGPSGCLGPIADYQVVIDNDQKTGNVNPSVYRRIAADLEGAKASCAAGRASEANARLAGVKSRYGYR
jgi:hypothetical protein